MKTVKRLICVSVILIIAASLFSICAAEPSAVLGLSPKKDKYSIGETVTVTCSMSTDVELYAYNCLLEYNPDVVQYVSGGKNDASGVKFVEGLSGEKSFSVSATFKTIAAGDCYFKFNGSCSDGSVDYKKNSGWTITVAGNTPAQKSTNANLASLSVNGGTLSPKFAANTVTYNVTVPNSTAKVTITAAAQDNKAKVSGAGACDLKVGKNVKTVTVTAESGAKKTYTVNITRQENTATPVDPEPLDPTDPTDPDPDTPDPLLVKTVEGTLRRISTNPNEMPALTGFMAETGSIEGIEINRFVESNGNKNYVLYVTTDESGEDPDYYYETPRGYKRLAYMTVNNNLYIVESAPDGMTAPDGYYESFITLNGTSAPAFKFEDGIMSDFYVLFCYANGEYGYYRYDSFETTVQRAPDFTFAKTAETDTKEIQKETSLLSDLIGRFKNATPLGKIIVFAIILCIILIVVAVVVLIVKLFKDKNDDDDEGRFSDDDGYYIDTMDDISSYSAPEIPLSQDVISESDTEVSDEKTEEQDDFNIAAQPQPETEPAAKEPEKAADDDDFDDDFADEESLKNLRGF